MAKDRYRSLTAVSMFSCCCLALVLAGVIASPTPVAAQALCSRPVADVLPLLESMEASWEEVTDYTSQLLKIERFIDGAITTERASIAFRKPDKLHFRLLEGAHAGAELLFPKPGTDDVVLARPGGVSGTLAGFLIKVPGIRSLVPYEFALDDQRLMAEQHHPVTASTIAGMLHLVAANLRLAAINGEGAVCFHPTELIDASRAIKVEILLPADIGIWHRVSEGESVQSISSDYGQDPYVVFYNNPQIHAKEALPVGEPLFVPRYYAPRALLWVSEALKLPVKVQIFDVENRLYEDYTNTALRLDVGLDEHYFDPESHGFPAASASEQEPAEAR